MSVQECNHTVGKRWVVAIESVPPQSGSFWYDYGKRYNERVVVELLNKRINGKRVCNVRVFTDRSVGDVVLSAWKEYNQHYSK